MIDFSALHEAIRRMGHTFAHEWESGTISPELMTRIDEETARILEERDKAASLILR